MRNSAGAAFHDAIALLREALDGPARRDIAAALADAPTLGVALQRLREGFRANVFNIAGRRVSLERVVNAMDRATQQEGFHVLHDWDGTSDRVNENSIPIDVLDYIAGLQADTPPERAVIAILLDYYFVHLLELCSLRIWDEGDPDTNLDRVAELLALLQSAEGSNQRFADDAETLILIATSHFELHERGYALLLERVRTLGGAHQAAIAISHASSIGSHLRFGFEATYARDTIVMRDDNVADYPWLCYALEVVMREYERRAGDEDDLGRDRVVEALLNGLSADARAFVGEAPASLAGSAAERTAFMNRFAAHRAALLVEFERIRPSEQHYAPLSFFFNFAHNVRKGTLVDALLRAEPWSISFNDLLTGLPRGDERNIQRELLANTLMTYARLNPDRIRGRLMPVIVYDPQAGRQAFGTTMRRLRT
jgi:hypothetical protein